MAPEIIVHGKGLGRHVNHDPRSLAYAYTAGPEQALVSVRHPRNGPVLDQGNLGSCTGNALLGALMTSPLYESLTQLGIDYDEATAVSIYSAATKLDSYKGTYPPTDTGSDGLSVAKAAKNDGYLSGYTHALTFNDALAALAAGPVITGVDWYDSFDNPGADGEMPLPEGANIRGGHELCVDEIDVENQRVWITNSWGEGWGLSGRAYWSFATWQKLLSKDGDATILVPITQPAPTPTPTPDPTPTPTPVSADVALAVQAHKYVAGWHPLSGKKMKTALKAWLAAKDL